MTEMLTTLTAGLPKLGLTLSEDTAKQLCRFGCAVVEQNKVMNLTAITSRIRWQSCIFWTVCPC